MSTLIFYANVLFAYTIYILLPCMVFFSILGLCNWMLSKTFSK